MEAEFWHQRWQDKDIGFHEGKANAFLVKYLNSLSLTPGDRIFVPLCGKTQDIGWLLAQGFKVIGVELSEIAVKELFVDLEVIPCVSDVDGFKQYKATNIEIFVGDFFQLSGEHLERINAVYDRAALVALPKIMRQRYTAHLQRITNTAPQLLVCYEYDQNQMEGPPFSISGEEISGHYGEQYRCLRQESVSVIGGIKGLCNGYENVWLLTN